MGKIIAVISAITAFLTSLLKVKQTNDWSPKAKVRKLRVEIARLESEKKVWQDKRSAYIRSFMPVPEQLQSKLDEVVRQLSGLERELSALETE